MEIDLPESVLEELQKVWKREWEKLTLADDFIFSRIMVFLLWGAHAQKKGELITNPIHYKLQTVHPSPLSANRGFFGCRHFSKTNALLAKHGIQPIEW